MNNQCDIIITYAWNRVGYNILRSLSSKGLKVVVADVSSYNITTVSNRKYGSFTYPDPINQEDEFIQVLIKNVNIYCPQMLIPTHDEGIIIAKHRNKFPKNLIIPIDSYEKLIKLSDKSYTAKLAEKLNIPIPKTFHIHDRIEHFPIVFKTKQGNSAKGVYFLNNEDELNHYKQKFKESEVFLQERVPGTDCSVDCIRINGKFYATVYKALLTKTHNGGTTTQREIIDYPCLIDYSKIILDYIDYYGVCGLDFKVDFNTNKIAFIEINPRYTGGIATPIQGGFDIPYIHYLLSIHNNHEIQVPTIKYGTKTKWILGDIITLVERIITLQLSRKEIRNIFSFSFHAFDDYFKDDPKIIWGEICYYFRKLWKNKKLNP